MKIKFIFKHQSYFKSFSSFSCFFVFFLIFPFLTSCDRDDREKKQGQATIDSHLAQNSPFNTESKTKLETQMSLKKEAKDFLEKNKSESGVQVTSSGLQYKILEEGSGKKPRLSQKVEVHYRGTFIDGSEFDSSYKRNKPAVFSLHGVIKGWQEGLQLMKEGAKYKFYIPSELAYGSMDRPGIPGHSVLIFEVELLKVHER